MTRLSNTARAAGLMIAAGAAFALVNTALQGATMLGGASAPAATFWQYSIAAIFYLPWIARNRAALRSARPGQQVLRVALGAVGVQLWTLGLAHVPIWQAIALILLSPFFVTSGAGLILGERVTPQRWIAVILGMIGGAVILAPWSDDFSLAALLPVGAAAFWAASSLVTKRLTEVDSAETITLYLLVLLTPLNFALAAGTGFALPPNAIWMVVTAGLVSAFAQHALARAYTLADAAFLQPFDLLKLPLNVGLGFLVFGFAPNGSMWAGTAIILAATLWLYARENRQASDAGDPVAAE
ncbi:MAG: DMT family transporter [Maritimibacter sp.]|jgi:drug/metabolite transporter (DMT)-like permease